MKCRICFNETKISYNITEMMYGTGESFKYIKCHSCGCLQIAEIPENINTYYGNNYYSFEFFDESKLKGLHGWIRLLKYKSSLTKQGFVNKLAYFLLGERRYDLLKKLNVNKDSKILDVGSGGGAFLYPLFQMGYKNILGIDPFLENDIVYKNGLNVKKKNIFEVSDGWDLITYNHVFEHVEFPQREANRIAEILKPGGYCIISVPTIESYAWHKYKTYWYQLDAPRHFYLHTLRSIKLIAENAGMTIQSVHYNSTFNQFFNSEMNRNGIAFLKIEKAKGWGKIAWKIKRYKYNKLSRLLNKRSLGDQFSIILKKD